MVLVDLVLNKMIQTKLYELLSYEIEVYLLILSQVSMSKDDNVPNYGKEKPGTEEGGGETEECPTPVQFYHRGEKILQEPKANINIINFQQFKL